MKKLIYTLKMYDYNNKKEADRDKPKMEAKGYLVKDEYESNANTYCIVYHKDTLSS